ncbi:phosphodiester glycosidase family protein [Bacteroides salyersiae]|nr:phosphodiester glycosidase family protein [Bacteroides salyersiae]
MGEYNDFENGREFEVSARVMAGMSQDGKTVYIVTVEGGTKESPGVNCIDIANWMLAHGSWNVVNFDSGGSATIAVDHEMLNYPMRGGEIRPVADALLVVSTEPESETVASYSFVVPNLYTTAVSLNPLTLLSFNEYGKVLEKGGQGFTYRCIPEDMGYVDADGVFHAALNTTRRAYYRIKRWERSHSECFCISGFGCTGISSKSIDRRSSRISDKD